MTSDTHIDVALIRRYLLGDVSEAERERVETTILLDDGYDEVVSVEEDELVDEYVAGELSAADAKRFETVFLVAPERRAKLRFARTLRGYVAAAPASRATAAAPTRRRWVPLAAAAAAVIVALGVGFVALRTSQLERELAAVRGERESNAALLRETEERLAQAERERASLSRTLDEERLERERLAAELANRPFSSGNTPSPAISRVAMLSLEPGRLRGASGSARLAIGRGVETLRLRLLDAPEATGPLAVSLRDPDGNVKWSGRALPSHTALVVSVPARGLEDDDYQVVIEDSTAVLARYYFRLSRK